MADRQDGVRSASRRAWRVGVVVLIVAWIQLALVPAGVVGSLVAPVIVAVAAGLALGSARGTAVGFLVGLVLDLQLTTPLGLGAGVLAVSAHLCGRAPLGTDAERWIGSEPPAPLVMRGAVATAAALTQLALVAGERALAAHVGVSGGHEGADLAASVGATALLAAVVGPVAVLAIRWADGQVALGVIRGRSPR